MSKLSASERRALIEQDNPHLAVSTQAELLDINRTTLYYTKKAEPERLIFVKHKMDEINTAFPFYGSRRIAFVLGQSGFDVSRKLVQRLMTEMGLLAIYPKKGLSFPAAGFQKFPYLLREQEAERPNHVWGTDITYVRMKGGFMYLTVLLDWYSRYVVSYALSDNLATDFVEEVLDDGFRVGCPEIINSDQGRQYTSNAYVERIKKESVDIRISMDGRGRCMDNIFTERFWRTYKYEEVYLKNYESPRECRRLTGEYIRFYNEIRPHSSLGMRTPAEVYFGQGIITKKRTHKVS